MAAVREDVKLDVVFREFMGSAVHMLLVRAQPQQQQQPPWPLQGASAADGGAGAEGPVVGLITLEDVLEEMIQVVSDAHAVARWLLRVLNSLLCLRALCRMVLTTCPARTLLSLFQQGRILGRRAKMLALHVWGSQAIDHCG